MWSGLRLGSNNHTNHTINQYQNQYPQNRIDPLWVGSLVETQWRVGGTTQAAMIGQDSSDSSHASQNAKQWNSEINNYTFRLVFAPLESHPGLRDQRPDDCQSGLQQLLKTTSDQIRSGKRRPKTSIKHI